MTPNKSFSSISFSRLCYKQVLQVDKLSKLFKSASYLEIENARTSSESELYYCQTATIKYLFVETTMKYLFS